MGKRKQKSDHKVEKRTNYLNLVTAILNLIIAVLLLIEKLTG